MEMFAIIQLLMQYGPLIKTVVESGVPIIKALQEGGASKVIPILEREGLKLFPQLKDPIKAVAAVADVLVNLVPKPGNVQDTAWVQASLNTLQAAKLDVDGSYGRETKAAVERFQRAHQGGTLDVGPVDGWAGPLTRKVIEAELAKL